MITPIAFHNIGCYTYTIFAVINFLIAITVFFTIPETAGRSLEEMDDIFSMSSKWNPYDVVRVERLTPRRYDQHGVLLALEIANPDREAAGTAPEKTSSMPDFNQEKKEEGLHLHTETSPVLE